MKKLIFTILCLFITISFVNAKENCEIVTGNGKDIGSEIACGDEHFYVIDNNGQDVKLLAKYNLYVGIEVNQTGPLYNNPYDAQDACEALEGYEHTEVWPSLSEPGKYYCHTEKELEYDEVKQSSEAVGLTMKDGNYVIRQVGIVYMPDDFDENTLDDENNIDLRYTEIQDYLDDYKDNLTDKGYTIKNIDLIRLSGFKELINKVSNEEVNFGIDLNTPYGYDNTVWEEINILELLHLNLNDYIPEEYSWIKSTTYWLGSSLVGNNESQLFDIFMTTLGDLCAINRGCSTVTKFGAGVRPVITIAASDLKYTIQTKTDSHGTIKVSQDTSAAGDEITFEIVPDKGYVLNEVKVTDALGNVIKFKDYKFTMPDANVLIEVSFVPDNPNTGTFIKWASVIIFLISAAAYIIFSTRTTKLYKL